MENYTISARRIPEASGEAVAFTTPAGASKGDIAGKPGHREWASSMAVASNPINLGGTRNDITLALALDGGETLTNPLFGLVLTLERIDVHLL